MLFQLFILLHLTILVILVILVLATFVERGNEGDVRTDRKARGTSKIAAEATASNESGRAKRKAFAFARR